MAYLIKSIIPREEAEKAYKEGREFPKSSWEIIGEAEVNEADEQLMVEMLWDEMELEVKAMDKEEGEEAS